MWEKLVKIGAKVVSHARYVTFQMAEVVVPRVLFCEILDRIRRLMSVAIPSGAGGYWLRYVNIMGQ